MNQLPLRLGVRENLGSQNARNGNNSAGVHVTGGGIRG